MIRIHDGFGISLLCISWPRPRDESSKPPPAIDEKILRFSAASLKKSNLAKSYGNPKKSGSNSTVAKGSTEIVTF